MAIEYLLNPVDEDDVIQKIKDDDFLCHITEYGASGCTFRTQEDAEEANMHNSIPSMDEQLRILALAKRIVRSNSVDENRSFESVMRTMQFKIRKEKSESIVQTTLDQFWDS